MLHVQTMSAQLILAVSENDQPMSPIEYFSKTNALKKYPRIDGEGLVPGRLCLCQPV